MKTVAIVQARMGSTRLPGKILKPLCDKSVLEHLISRIDRCKEVDLTVIATTVAPHDTIVAETASDAGAAVFRGSEDNVLERYFQAACEYNADTVIRITSDCPLYDPNLLCEMLNRYKQLQLDNCAPDYFANNINRTYPAGLDTEIFPINILERAIEMSSRDYEFEHVTPYIRENPALFTKLEHRNSTDLSHLRWTLDTADDFRMIETVYDTLYPENPEFTTDDILKLLKERPDITKINAHVKQKNYKRPE